MDNLVRTVALPGGERIPVLGIGTWNMAGRRTQRADEIAALQMALDLGMTVIDTAEMYGDGAAEDACRRGDRQSPERSFYRQQGVAAARHAPRYRFQRVRQAFDD